MNNIELFIQSYNKIDSFMRSKLNCDMSVSHAKLLTQMAKIDNVFLRLESRLQAYRALRNAIVHIHNDGETPIATPNNEVAADYQRIVSYALKPPLALESIAIIDVYSVFWETKIADLNHLMLSKGLSLIPIVKDNKIEGIFSSWLFQKYLFDSKINFNRQMPLIEMYSALNLNQPELYINYNFRIGFQKKDVSIDTVINYFSDSAKNNNYFKAVYLTENGKAFEKILGLITPHSLPSINPLILDKKLLL